MTPDQIKIEEGNRLIAKFKGWFEEEDGLEGNWYEIQGYGKYVAFSTYKETYRDLPFHRSWEYLMDVVEQIEKLNNFVLIGAITCTIHSRKNDVLGNSILCSISAESKKEAVWLAVVDFINWYNKINYERKETNTSPSTCTE